MAKISRTFEKSTQNSSVDMFVTKDPDGIINIGISKSEGNIPNNVLLSKKTSALFADMSDKKLLSKFFRLSETPEQESNVAAGLKQLSSDEFFKDASLLNQ